MASQAMTKPTALAGIWGEMMGEFFGTMVLLLFGDGCVASFFGTWNDVDTERLLNNIYADRRRTNARPL
jgi:glycerol uptake facilitator-like aquaporin